MSAVLNEGASPQMLWHAIEYAKHGVPVFPVWGVTADGRCLCGSDHADSLGQIGKHPIPRDGQKSATTDPAVIRSFWKTHPRANIATVPALAAVPLVVLDLDPRNGSAGTIAELEHLHGRLIRSVACKTGGGGEHVYFLAPQVSDLLGKAGPGADIKHKGYVILPPSRHASGGGYAWQDGRSLLDEDARDFLVDAPSWMHAEAATRDPSGEIDPLAIIDPTEVDTPELRQRIESALKVLPPDGDRDSYYRPVLMALSSTGLHDAHVIARRWADGSMHGYVADKYSDKAFQRDWKSLTNEKNSLITLGTLFKVAKDAGWVDARSSSTAVETFGDISNGHRFASKHRGQFLYAYAADKWLRWDGLRWAWCDSGEDIKAAREIVAESLDDAHAALREDSNERNRGNYAHALSVHRNARRLPALLTVAASEEGMNIGSPAMLDADPWLLAVRNGVVNLRSGNLVKAEPTMLVSRQAGAAFDVSAQCPRWLKFLGEIFGGDAEMLGFIQRACGYALTGLVDEEVLFFMWGTGANGKSVFANVLHAVFGDYAVTVRATMLARDLKGSGSDAEREKNKLPGARLALINEVASGDVFDDQRVKELVSRERISARALYAESFEFMPSHKIFIRGNHQPGALDATEGFWRRVLLIGFTRQISENERVPDLDRQIVDGERDGILAWMVDGCLAWQRGGLRVPASIRAASEQYRRDTDLLGEWLAACCKPVSRVETPVSELFASYRVFLQDANVKAPAAPVFGRQLAQRGFKARRSNGRQLLGGIELISPFRSVSDDSDDDGL